jgi:predicted ATPase
MRLELLTEQDVVFYLAKRLGKEKSTVQIATAIHRRTEGNPLFMVNAVDYLLRLGSIMNPGRIEAPPTIRQMIIRNFERLDVNEQQVLEAASVAGAEFSAAAVAAALDQPLTEVEGCCVQLARRVQFINSIGAVTWPNGISAAAFRFSHSLYLDVLYERVPAGQRNQFHRRIAEREENAFGARASDIAVELAHHYRNANQISKAILYLTIAGEQAIRRAAHAEAVSSISAAVDLVNSLPDDSDRGARELQLQIMLGGSLTAIKGFAASEVKYAYARARELCSDLGQPLQLPALYGLWVYHLVRGEIDVALELAEKQCLCLAEAVGNPALLMQANLQVGGTLLHVGDYTRAFEYINRSLALYDVDNHRLHAFIYGQDPKTIGSIYAGLILWHLGYPDQALEKMNQSLTLANELRYPLSKAFSAGFAAWLHQARGDVEETRKQAEAALSLAAEHGFPLPSGMAHIFLGWALAQEGQPQRGIELIQRGRELCEGTGALLIRPYFLVLLAEAYREGNQIQEGRAALAAALASARSSGERGWEAEILRLMAEFQLRALTGSEAEAEQHLQSAIKIARSQNAKSLQLRAASTLGGFLISRKRPDEARTLLTSTYNWFTEGFDTPALREARLLIEQLT